MIPCKAKHLLKTEMDQHFRANPAVWTLLQQTSLDGVWYWNLENLNEKWISPEFWRLLGRTPDTEIHGRQDLLDLIEREDLKQVLANCMAHCANPNHPFDQRLRFKHQDGSTVHVRCRGFAVRNARGRAIRMLGTQTKSTARIRADGNSRALASANKELRSFAYAVSHDLKSPLNTVNMLLNELEETDGAVFSKDGKHLLSLANSTVKRMQIQIEELLRYTGIVGEVVEFEPVSIQGIVDNVISDLRWDIEKTGARIDCGPLPTAWAHRSQIRMLMQNLISNAIKFVPHGTTAHVQISAKYQEDNRVSITVLDNGIGIEQHNQEKIFGIFSRLHRAEEYPGTGVGLALCQRIVMNHGGDISIVSKPGAGTSFTVSLPLHQT